MQWPCRRVEEAGGGAQCARCSPAGGDEAENAFFFFLKELDKRCAVPCLKVISHRPLRFTPPVILIQRVNSMGPCETYWANVMLLLENGGWALGFIDTGLI